MRISGWALGLMLGLLAVAGQAAWTAVSTEPAPTPEVTAAPSGVATATQTVAPTQATYKVGETATVDGGDGEPWLRITISDVKVVKSYKGKILTDVPHDGNVFIQAKVTYEAVQGGIRYNVFDWVVTCGGKEVNSFVVVLSGPKPALESGMLAAGEEFAAWAVYEVPPKGEVRMGYRGESLQGPAMFETIIRAG